MTVGSGIWRSIGNYAYRSAEDQPYGVYLNGFLHWVGYSGKSPYFICALDLDCECFQQIPLPPGFCLSWPASPTFELGVLKCRLFITVHRLNNMIVWVMKDYGVKESCTPELKIIIRGLFSSLSFPQVLNHTEEGEVLLLDISDLHVFASKAKGSARVEIDRVRLVEHANAHIPSLVSLKDVIKG